MTRCLHVALPVAAFLEMLTKPVSTRATTRAGNVQRGKTSFFRSVASWPKTKHTPAEHQVAHRKQDQRYGAVTLQQGFSTCGPWPTASYYRY